MVKVRGSIKEKYSVEINAREHVLTIDEPKLLGGFDLGPKPDEVLLSALIGCKIITVKMYAEHKGWRVENVSVELKLGDKVGERTEIEKSIQIEGELDEAQLTRLVEISNRCPMAKLVANSVVFKLV